MKIQHWVYLLFFIPTISFSQLLPREKVAQIEKEFGQPTWNQFGDLVFEKNGKFYWLSTFSNVQYDPYDYYRLFEIDFKNGQVTEVTKKMLGDHYRVEIGRVPYHYKDIDNDGIKDIFVFDIGKELLSTLPQEWKYFNTYFKGTKEGFVKTEIPEITNVKRYHHAQTIKDFDLDGDMDIAFSAVYPRIYLNDGKGNFSEMIINNLIQPNNGDYYIFDIDGKHYNTGTFSMGFTNLDNDPELEILFPIHNRPIYLDFSNGSWNAKLFGKENMFIYKENIHIGVEDIVEIPNGSKNDIFFRIASFDTIANGNGNQKWITKFFIARAGNLEDVREFTNSFLTKNSCFYLDPKLVDINFDGYPDLFFKEDEFWGNTGQQLHTIDQRIWLNDGKNNFEPIKYKFNDELRKLVYIYAKTDTSAKSTVFFSQRRVLIQDKNNPNDQFYLATRFDTLVYPINQKIIKKVCVNSTQYEKLTMTPIKFKLVSAGDDVKIKFNDFGIEFVSAKPGIHTVNYQIYNDFFESETFQIVFDTQELPQAAISSNGPTTINQNGNVVLTTNNVSGLTYQWFKDGIAINSANTNTYTATTAGSYTVKVTNLSGCEFTSEALVVKTVFLLPHNNFKVNIQGETCRTSDNGKVSFSALQKYNYTATLSKAGQVIKTINFTENSELSEIAAGEYTLCFSISSQVDFKQCFDIVITEPKDLSVYSQLNPSQNILKLALSGGSKYLINLNGETITTSTNLYDLKLRNGLNKIRVVTDKECQGAYQEEIFVNEKVLVYPNPFTDILNLKINQEENSKVLINVYDGAGFPVYRASHNIQGGLVSLNLSKLDNGYYTITIGKEVYKVLKK